MLTKKSVNPSFESREFIEDRSHDPLLEFQNRTRMIMGWTAAPFLFPFAIISFNHEQPILGLLILFLAVDLPINSYLIYKKRRIFIPYGLFYAVMLLTIVYAIAEIGIAALFWCYPGLFVVGFITQRSCARLMTVIGLLILIPASFLLVHFDMALRFSVTLCMLCALCDLLVGHLNKLQLRLTELAIRDPLTNAFNRRQMGLYLQEAIEENKRDFGSASLVLLDIDHFKNINDKFGHETGDKVLTGLVDMLHKRQRKVDYVFRIGGEEFLILLRKTTLQQALTTAESLRKHTEENTLLENETITISLGVAEYKPDESADEWLARADHHLYEAKNAGRNRVDPAIT